MGFGKDRRKILRESLKCWDLVRLILETWWYFCCKCACYWHNLNRCWCDRFTTAKHCMHDVWLKIHKSLLHMYIFQEEMTRLLERFPHKYLNSLAPGKCGNNFTFYRLSSWRLLPKLLWGECQRTSLMITHGVNIRSTNGLVLLSNKPLPEPMLTQIYVVINTVSPGPNELNPELEFLDLFLTICTKHNIQFLNWYIIFKIKDFKNSRTAGKPDKCATGVFFFKGCTSQEQMLMY